MGYRKYRLGSYDEMRAQHRWEVPARYNIATDVSLGLNTTAGSVALLPENAGSVPGA